MNTISREFVLRSYLGAVKRDYDYILIDCMLSLGMLTIDALAAANSVLIPCQASYLSTKGLKLLMGSVAKVRRQINPALKIDGILLTMVDSRTNNAKSIIAALRQTGSNLRVLNTEIPLVLNDLRPSYDRFTTIYKDLRQFIKWRHEMYPLQVGVCRQVRSCK